MDYSNNNQANNGGRGSNQQAQNEIVKIDNDCEYISSLIREENNPLSYQQAVNSFIESNKQLCGGLIKQQEFKNSFFIYRKIEKVLALLFKKLEQYDDQNFPIKLINTYLSSQILEVDSSKVNKISQELVPKKLPQKNAYEYSSKVLDQLICCINNQGTIYMLRGKVDVAINCFCKAFEARSKYLSTNQQQYQIAIIILNMAFCLKNKENFEESNKLLNKSILIIEQIEKISKEFSAIENLIESSSQILCLLEMLYNKNEKDFKEDEITQRQKLLYLLSISYNYYGEILTKLSKTKEADFCKKQSETLFKQFRKKFSQSGMTSQDGSLSNLDQRSSIGSGSGTHLTQKIIQKKFPNNNQDKQMDDNFSHASFQTVNTTQSFAAFGGQNISKDNIIFQKYMQVDY